ncbi:hypothetical protein IEQ34_009581 [Dendrobium chrysotoxum]|uniref:Uncharacterized protein n=1 Tax=Dendrobium chrysotoxum TaxID=161865 RepID=A0AAV7H0R9_DENCH|nr:hypothetical protein IEQ34_009581 [Dendrobium chrysotoxum]
MELISRSESRGIAPAAALESVLKSVVMETILDAGKSLLWLLCVMPVEYSCDLASCDLLLSAFIFWFLRIQLLVQMGSSPNGANLFDDGCEISEGFPLSSLRKVKGETMPENKDDGESDDEEDEDEDEAGDQEDDGGEEDYSGDEGNEEEDEEELEANGGGGSEDEDGDEDDEDEDEDGDDEDDEEDAEEEEDDEDQPPPKKSK